MFFKKDLLWNLRLHIHESVILMSIFVFVSLREQSSTIFYSIFPEKWYNIYSSENTENS